MKQELKEKRTTKKREDENKICEESLPRKEESKKEGTKEGKREGGNKGKEEEMKEGRINRNQSLGRKKENWAKKEKKGKELKQE